MLRKLPFVMLAAAAIMLAASCRDDPAKPIRNEDEIPWPAMTGRDDVIKTIVLAYSNPKDGESAAKYSALLHSEYFFGLAPEDVPPGEPQIMTRAEDIAATEWIFDYESLLELAITPEEGSWYEQQEIEGEPCENCWETQRQYFIRVQFGDDDTIYQSAVGRAFAVFIVAPDEGDPTKWVLRAIYDLGIAN